MWIAHYSTCDLNYIVNQHSDLHDKTMSYSSYLTSLYRCHSDVFHYISVSTTFSEHLSRRILVSLVINTQICLPVPLPLQLTSFLNTKCWRHISENLKHRETTCVTHRCKTQTIVFTNRIQQKQRICGIIHHLRNSSSQNNNKRFIYEMGMI